MNTEDNNGGSNLSERIEVLIIKKLDEVSNDMTYLKEATKENKQDIKKLKEDTFDIIQLNKDIQGVARIGAKVKNILIAVSGFGIIGAAATWILDKLGN